MAVRRILTFGEPALRERATDVDRVTDLHRKLVDDMIETMRAAPGVGLAGPQIGVLDRIFVWEVEEDHGAVINPRITSSSDDTTEEEEGCLSLPGIYYPVVRPASVTVEGIDEGGEPVKLEAEGLLARVCQHEIDHLDGVLFVDRLPEELRKEALAALREQLLTGVATPPAHPEEML